MTTFFFKYKYMIVNKLSKDLKTELDKIKQENKQILIENIKLSDFNPYLKIVK